MGGSYLERDRVVETTVVELSEWAHLPAHWAMYFVSMSRSHLWRATRTADRPTGIRCQSFLNYLRPAIV